MSSFPQEALDESGPLNFFRMHNSYQIKVGRQSQNRSPPWAPHVVERDGSAVAGDLAVSRTHGPHNQRASKLGTLFSKTEQDDIAKENPWGLMSSKRNRLLEQSSSTVPRKPMWMDRTEGDDALILCENPPQFRSCDFNVDRTIPPSLMSRINKPEPADEQRKNLLDQLNAKLEAEKRKRDQTKQLSTIAHDASSKVRTLVMLLLLARVYTG